ncbi:MAG: tRNA pseudouridine(38-40) synthase TruA [Clostridiales bacterium]|nr:tRNA pseudouridine(38-40) synthase TruA [Clostridiales bacterium]
MTRNLKLELSYDGTELHGWQWQENAVSVQNVLSDAVFSVTAEHPVIYGCGRTDAGVHAKGYVCSFTTESGVPTEKFVGALNNYLPDSVVVRSCEEAPPEFNARYDVTSKTYRYAVYDSRVADPFLRNRAYHHPGKLDAGLMARAAKEFEGEHDFTSFCASHSVPGSKVRTVYSARVSEEGGLTVMDFTGSGFLYNMVRIMAGTLVEISEGKITDTVARIIENRDRLCAGRTLPACGLYLMKVEYGDKKEINS